MYHRSCRLTLTLVKNDRAGKQVHRRGLSLRHKKPVNLDSKPAGERGGQQEDVAAAFFLKRKEQQRFAVRIFMVGFVIPPAKKWLGASPNRYVHITRFEPSADFWCLLEIKTFDSEKTLD